MSDVNISDISYTHELNEHVSDKLTNLRIQRQIMNVKLSYYQVTP